MNLIFFNQKENFRQEQSFYESREPTCNPLSPFFLHVTFPPFSWIFVHRQRSDADVMSRPRSLERGDRFAPLSLAAMHEKKVAQKEAKNLPEGPYTLVWSDK